MNRRVRQVFAGGLLVALPAAIGLALIAESLIVLLERFGAPGYLIAGAIFLGFALVLLVRGPWLRRRPPWADITGHPALPARVVVVTASLGPGASAVVRVVDHHRTTLERLYVLRTADEAGEAAMSALRTMLRDAGWPLDRLRERPVTADATDDPGVAYAELLRIVDDAERDGYEPRDIVFDYTGGTKAFTAAMTLAGAPDGRRLEYVAPRERDASGKPASGAELQVIEVDLSFKVSAERLIEDN